MDAGSKDTKIMEQSTIPCMEVEECAEIQALQCEARCKISRKADWYRCKGEKGLSEMMSVLQQSNFYIQSLFRQFSKEQVIEALDYQSMNFSQLAESLMDSGFVHLAELAKIRSLYFSDKVHYYKFGKLEFSILD